MSDPTYCNLDDFVPDDLELSQSISTALGALKTGDLGARKNRREVPTVEHTVRFVFKGCRVIDLAQRLIESQSIIVALQRRIAGQRDGTTTYPAGDLVVKVKDECGGRARTVPMGPAETFKAAKDPEHPRHIEAKRVVEALKAQLRKELEEA